MTPTTDDAVAAAAPRAVDGRVPGRRGRATRQRLLESTLALLDTTAFRELKVVDIARAAGTSPATFYQYFPDIEAALLALADELADGGGRELCELVESGDWSPAGAYVTAQHVADGYLKFWAEHRALIGVIDLATLEGDQRFRDLRTALLSPVSDALELVAANAVTSGRVPAQVEPHALSAVLVSMLAHVAAHRPGLSDHGIDPDALRDALARILAWSVAAVDVP